MEPTTEPVPDPVEYTRERLHEIAVVWMDATKRKLGPLLDKVPPPIAKYLKGRSAATPPPEGEEPPAKAA